MNYFTKGFHQENDYTKYQNMQNDIKTVPTRFWTVKHIFQQKKRKVQQFFRSSFMDLT